MILHWRNLLSLLVLFTGLATGSEAQMLTDAQAQLLRQSAAIVQTDSTSLPDWRPLHDQLKNKKLILLGEFTHGAREIFQLRHSLIRYLHEQLGVDVILFEAGIGELIIADSDKQSITPSDMTNGLFGAWRTKEFVELMDYIRANSMSIAGFDVQRTGNSFNDVLSRIARHHLPDSNHFSGLESRYGSVTRALSARGAVYDSLSTKVNKLIADYSQAIETIESLKKKGADLGLTKTTFENRIAYLTYMLQFVKDSNWHRRWAARDSCMARNVRWLLGNMYGDRKVAIVGHNFHIARYNENETVMGELLAEWYGSRMYAIGFFAGSGSYADNAGNAKRQLPPETTRPDVKHVIAAMQGDATFLSLSKKVVGANAYLDKPLVVNDTFIDLAGTNTLDLARSFDGIVLLKRVSPPR